MSGDCFFVRSQDTEFVQKRRTLHSFPSPLSSPQRGEERSFYYELRTIDNIDNQPGENNWKMRFGFKRSVRPLRRTFVFSSDLKTQNSCRNVGRYNQKKRATTFDFAQGRPLRACFPPHLYPLPKGERREFFTMNYEPRTINQTQPPGGIEPSNGRTKGEHSRFSFS